MPKITEYKLKKELKNQNFSNIYFLYGEEKYMLKHYTRKIASSLIGENFTSFNFKVLNAEELTVEKLYNSLEFLPFNSSKKCVVINNFSFDNFSKDQVLEIKKIIEEIFKTTFLIVSQKDNFEGKLTVKQLSLLSFFEKNGSVVEFKILTEKELVKQLIFWAKCLSVDLDSKCALKLIEKSSKNLEILKNELLKICAFSEYKIVTENMIEILVSENIQNTIFSLSNEIIEKRCDKAFSILNNLIFNKNDPTMMLAIISNSFVDLYRVKIAKEIGKDIDSLAREIGYNKNKIFRLKLAEKQCNKFTKKDLLKYIEVLVNADFLLKNSSLNKKIILEEAIARMFL